MQTCSSVEAQCPRDAAQCSASEPPRKSSRALGLQRRGIAGRPRWYLYAPIGTPARVASIAILLCVLPVGIILNYSGTEVRTRVRARVPESVILEVLRAAVPETERSLRRGRLLKYERAQELYAAAKGYAACGSPRIN